MKIQRLAVFIALMLGTVAAAADWTAVAPGVDYQEFNEPGIDVYVTRIDLTNRQIAVIATRESDRGTRVSDFAKGVKAIAAINGDYFDDAFHPIGLTLGLCGRWNDTRDTQREGVVAVGPGKALIAKQSDVMPQPPDWAGAVISGWPMLVDNCDAVSPLPGSDAFTRSPHPRTAVGVSGDRKTLYFVVADGRRTGVPGFTLPQLASFFANRLRVCYAMNLDGGGSASMWVGDRIVNRPSDGVERRVADHLAVVLSSDLNVCNENEEAERVALLDAREAAQKAAPASSGSSNGAPGPVPPKR